MVYWTWTLVLILTSLWRAESSSTINLRIPILEEQEKGTVVASLSVNFGAKKILQSSPMAHLNYKLLETATSKRNDGLASSVADANQPWVTLNTETGDLTLSRRIDREVDCLDKQLKCEQKLQVVRLPQDYFKMAMITLHVVDTNDNSPTFELGQIIENVSESVEIGTEINLDKYQAKDYDMGDNAVIKYSLSDTRYFGLKQYMDRSGISHLRLIIRKKLDFSDKISHELELTATDKGLPKPLSSTIPLVIRVLDANDHAPVFDREIYITNLSENLSPGEIIAKVRATDEDSGAFGKITYHLPPTKTDLLVSEDGAVTSVGNLISLGPFSGEVKLRQKLDRELHDGLRIVIEARDSGADGAQKSGRTVLEIHVADVNDNAPVINVDFIVDQKDGVAYVPESSPVNNFIALIGATDEDNGRNGEYTLQLLPYTGKGDHRTDVDSFALSEDGLLATANVFDSEKKNIYKILIKACDKGSPPLCSNKTLSIYIFDENEHPPVFPNPSQRVTLPENSKVGRHIATCKATDQDSTSFKTYRKSKETGIEASLNGKMSYRIQSVGVTADGLGHMKSPFSFDMHTGKITLKHSLDYEKARRWKITVSAKDGGVPALESYCVVTVTLDDVNDNRPVFTTPAIANSSLSVGITDQNNKPILVIKAIDFDQDIASGISYEIKHQYIWDNTEYRQSNKDIFYLNPENGELISKTSTEEDVGKYYLVIRANDEANITLYRDVGMFVILMLKSPARGSHLIPPGRSTQKIITKEDTPFTMLAIALGVGIGVVILLIIIVALLVTYIRKKNTRGTKEFDEESPKLDRSPSLGKYSSSSSDKQSSRNDAMLSSLTSSPTSTMGKRSIFNNNLKGSTSCSKPPIESEPCYVCDLKNSSPSIGQHSPYHKLVENMMICGKNSLPKPTSPSDHDSGQGSSDTKEFDDDLSKHFTYDLKDIKESGGMSLALTDASQPLGPKCSQACRELGHSDACWMPTSTFYVGQPHQVRSTARHGSVCSSETENTTSSSSGPPYYRINIDRSPNKCPPVQNTSGGQRTRYSSTDSSSNIKNFRIEQRKKSPQRHHSDSGRLSVTTSTPKVRSPSRAGGSFSGPARRPSDSAAITDSTRPSVLKLPRLPYQQNSHFPSNDRSPTKVTFANNKIPQLSSPKRASSSIVPKTAAV